MAGCNGDGVRINSFALVSYLPEPLAGFLDRLRRELVQECHAKAHVTVLPPRPLPSPVEEAWQEVKDNLQNFNPFHLELGQIEIFPTTGVIYLSVNAGHAELERMHRALNSGRLAFEEPFQYHPHVTLAQELERDRVSATAELAERQWRAFSHPRGFTVNRLTFVQNTLENRWADLWGRSLTCPGPPQPTLHNRADR